MAEDNLFSRYFKPTPKKVKKALLAVKGFLGSIAASEYISGNPTTSFWIVVIIGVIHEITELLTEESNGDTNNT